MNKFFAITLMMFCSMTAWSQVAINNTGTTSAASSSMLDVSSTSKGVLLPRMTSAQRKAIAGPETGLLVYDTDRQTIYLFDGENWKPMMSTMDHLAPMIQRIPAGVNPYGQFGSAVDIDGNYAVVGAPQDTANNIQSGSIYIYFKENGTWKQQVKLTAPNAVSGDMFGSSVSIKDDVIVVGAPGKTISGAILRGRVYVYKRFNRTWNYVIGLQASNGALGDQFGTSVAIDNGMIIAGAPYTSYAGKTNAGSAYIYRFENSSWLEKKILNPADPVNNGQFGFTVDISGYTAAAGAVYATTGGVVGTGAVYLFNNTDFVGATWASGQKLEPDVKQSQMKFGHAIDIEGNRLVIGAPDYAPAGSFSVGRGLEFKRTNGVWSTGVTLGETENFGQVGTAVAIDGDFTFFSYPGWDDAKGKVLYFPTTIIPSRYLYSNDPQSYSYFGKVMAADDGQIIIGVPGYESTGMVLFGVID